MPPIKQLTLPFRVLVAQRQAIAMFVNRDIRSRYVTSALGMGWVVIHPLGLLLLYTFVFSQVMKVRFTEAANTFDFAFYLFCGLLPWIAFAESLSRSTTVIAEQSPLVKKMVFPSEILPVHVVLSALLVEFGGLAVLLGGIVVGGRPPGWSLLALPVLVCLQFLLTTGLAWLLAPLAVFVPDIRQVITSGLTFWMFVTPIVYPTTMVPERFHWVLDINPMAHLVQAYRAVVLEHQLPPFAPLAVLSAVALLVFVSGYWAFDRSKRAFADFL